MKVRTPLDRNDLKIGKHDRVLEIGSGHNPSYRSNVLCEKFMDSNYHRCGDVKVYPHQIIKHGDGENLPFDNKEFDYIICNQVLEHSENPDKFISEMCRVASRGYLETPSLLGEFLFPKKSHKWVILEIDNKLVFYEKEKMLGNYLNNYGELFLNYLPFSSLPYKLLWLTEGNIMINRYEWKDKIDFIVNPTDDYYLSFFTQAWNREMVQKLFPKRPLRKELGITVKALLYIIKREFISKVISKKRHPLDLEDYMLNHKINHV